MSRIPWDQFETALLIDAYIKVKTGEIPRDLAVRQLSDLLREYGKRKGVIVDDIYRNINGISMRMSEIAYLFNDGHRGLKNTSKLFVEMVGLFKSQRDRFEEILAEAKILINPSQSNKKAFEKWLRKQSNLTLSVDYIISTLNEGSSYAINHGTSNTAIWNMTDETEVAIAFQKMLSPYSWYRMTHRKQIVSDLAIAVTYYKQFIKERQRLTANDAEKPLEPLEGSREKDDFEGESNQSVIESLYTDETVHTPQDCANANTEDHNTQSDREDDCDQVNVFTDEDRQIREQNPSLYDQVFSVMQQLQKEHPDGVIFLDIYDEIGRSFSEVKKILWSVSWVIQQHRRFLLKKDAILSHEKTILGQEKEDISETANEPSKQIEENKTDSRDLAENGSSKTEDDDKLESEEQSGVISTVVAMQEEQTTEEQDEDDIIGEREQLADTAEEDHEQLESQSHLEEEETPSVQMNEPLSTSDDEPIEDEEDLSDKLYALLKSICDKNKYGTTLYFLASTLNAPKEAVKSILDKANWAKNEYNRYKFVYEAIEGEMTYDFVNPQSLAYTKPVSLTYFEETLIKPGSWRQLFIEFMKLINEDYPHYIKDLKGIVFSGASVPLVADKGTAAKMWNPKEVAEGLYIETNRSANDIMVNVRRVIDACYVDYENIVIRYTSKAVKEDAAKNTASHEWLLDKSQDSITLEEAICKVLSDAEEPLSVQEILDRIEYDTPYHFTAKDPLYFLKSRIEMACQGSGYSYQAGQVLFGSVDDFGKKKYYLLSQENAVLKAWYKICLQEKALQRAVKSGGIIQKSPFPFVRTGADTILVEKYPVLFKRVYLVMKEFGKKEVTIQEVFDKIGKIARISTIRQILDYASWTIQIAGNKYRYSSTPVQCNIPKELQQKQTAVVEKKAKIENGSNQKAPELKQVSKTNSHPGSSHILVTEEGFYTYVRTVVKMAESSCKGYISAIHTSEKYGVRNGIIHHLIFGSEPLDALSAMEMLMANTKFTAFNASQHYRFSAAFVKLSDYIKKVLCNVGEQTTSKQVQKSIDQTEAFDKEKYIAVLMQRYRNGMTFDSIDFDNFRDTYEMLYDEKLEIDDTVMEKQLRQCGVIYMDRLFPAEGIIDNQTKEELFQYIDNSFASGKTVLYYKAIYEHLAGSFASCFVLTGEEMLRAYLKFVSEPGKYYFFDNYMTKERFVKIDHNAEVAQRLLIEGKPMKVDDLCTALSHIPSEQVKRILTTDKQFIWNARGEYFHKDIFEVSDEELEQIAGIIDSYIAENEYVIWTDVWSDIQTKMPCFIENNLYLSSYGVREILARCFSGRFSFKAMVISLPNRNLQMWDVYQLFAKHHSTFTIEDLNNLSKELDCGIYFDAIYRVAVRVSHDQFVSKKLVNFDVDAIDKAIESFMAKDYIRIREIDSFLAFPNVGYEWNAYLLESFLLSFSKKFILLSNGSSLHNVAGAVVKKDGPIREFVDACAHVLADGSISLKKDEALDYLVATDMITRRSYRNIDDAIRKAIQIRATRG